MAADITQEIAHSVWYGWGDPAMAKPLGQNALDYLASELATTTDASNPPVGPSAVRLRESRLTIDTIAELKAIVGEGNVSTERMARIVHAGGKSTPDLIRRRSGDAMSAPDAVVSPQSSEQVSQLLRYCAAERIAVVPFGGGTSVVGGVEPISGRFETVITVDLGALNNLLSIDLVSRTATFEAGIRGPAVEKSLSKHGFTLGHLPQSHQQATLGGYAATRSAGQSSTGYGRSDELITALRIETPEGTLRVGGHAPKDAAGPHLLDLVLGSEGTLGIITEVTVAIVPVPAEKSYGAWSFPSWEGGTRALRALIQDAQRGDVPDVCRLSDEEETDANFRIAGGRTIAWLRRYLRARGHDHPALALFVWEGTNTAARKRRCARIFAAYGGVYVTSRPAKSWDDGRFNAPYRRDELLARGIFVETLETAGGWSHLPETHAAVHAAIKAALTENGARCHVQTHLSHVYRGGASLYYTFVAPIEDDPLEQFRRVKVAASLAIMAAGATITHHHGVGLDHAPYLAEQVGELGERLLSAAKNSLDPVGIMNPTKLITEQKAVQDV